MVVVITRRMISMSSNFPVAFSPYNTIGEAIMKKMIPQVIGFSVCVMV